MVKKFIPNTERLSLFEIIYIIISIYSLAVDIYSRGGGGGGQINNYNQKCYLHPVLMRRLENTGSESWGWGGIIFGLN